MSWHDILNNLLKGINQTAQDSSILGLNNSGRDESDLDDIKTYSLGEIFRSGRFTPEERRQEYRRRGKSPSGVIDGIYNDTYLEDGEVYNDINRDWDADS